MWKTAIECDKALCYNQGLHLYLTKRSITKL